MCVGQIFCTVIELSQPRRMAASWGTTSTTRAPTRPKKKKRIKKVNPTGAVELSSPIHGQAAFILDTILANNNQLVRLGTTDKQTDRAREPSSAACCVRYWLVV